MAWEVAKDKRQKTERREEEEKEEEKEENVFWKPKQKKFQKEERG